MVRDIGEPCERINATIFAVMFHLGDVVLSSTGHKGIIVTLLSENRIAVHGTLSIFDTPYLAVTYELMEPLYIPCYVEA